MKTAGIVAEFDPFHNGHAYLLDSSRRRGATHTVCVMSSLFTQRGEPAAISERARTQAALRNGADLVLELPLPWSCAGAEVFARGAVYILASLGCVDTLVFGSELGDAEKLGHAVSALKAADGSQALRQALDSGASLPKARAAAAEELCPGAGSLGPNDILAAEYIGALERFAPGIEPQAVSRTGAGHDESGRGLFTSAKHIRALLSQRKTDDALGFVPDSAAEVYRQEFSCGRAPFLSSAWELIALSSLRSADKDYLASLPDVCEGLENRLWRASREALSLDDFYKTVKTKRYTMARIRRITCCAALGVTSALQSGLPPYIRVLGLNSRGGEILACADVKIPLVTRAADTRKLGTYGRGIYSLNCRAADLWGLCLPQRLPCGETQRGSPIIL
jgi:predicted nucleotidyltransferase